METPHLTKKGQFHWIITKITSTNSKKNFNKPTAERAIKNRSKNGSASFAAPSSHDSNKTNHEIKTRSVKKNGKTSISI